MKLSSAQPDPESERRAISLQGILRSRASSTKGAVICYPLGNTSASREFSYSELFKQAIHYGQIIRSLPGFNDGQPVLLHLEEQWDNIVWFWAVLTANGLPVLSSPFSAFEEHRLKHIHGLSNLLEVPICITRNNSINLFEGSQALLQLYTIESLCEAGFVSSGRGELYALNGAASDREKSQSNFSCMGGDDLAILMLTSGSTGNAKAVCLTHKQVIAAISGKASVRPLRHDGPFLNWIGLDHVASLVEIHIQALFLAVDQVHVHAADVVSSPKVFLDLLSRHRVSRTFAPNFFLGQLVSTTQAQSGFEPYSVTWDLSNLQMVASGGEANDLKTCAAASSLFQRYGARQNVLTPGFGMTETCAGSIFNLACPDYDIEQGYTVASLGKCMKGIEMRVSVDSRLATTDEPGDLEVRGEVVFDGYYRNPRATADAFPSKDGWFRTGDQASIDNTGNLRLIGRKDDIININGIKIGIPDLDSLLDLAIGDRVTRFVVFPSRAAHTEQINIAYVPKTYPHGAEYMAKIDDLAARACLTSVSARPVVFSLREESLPFLPASSLGKISRAKVSSLFESGVFELDMSSHREALNAYKVQAKLRAPTLLVTTEAETLLIDDFAKTINIEPDTLGPETPFFDLGFTSMDLIRLKQRIDTRLGAPVPVITIMRNCTPRLLAAALQASQGQLGRPEQTVVYDPVVVLKSSGTKTPLWLVHPGVGEILVFVGLAQHLADDDWPIYALRAKGFEQGQTTFSSINEAVNTYVQAIKRKQPRGPYALAGYSYGAMLAFEVAKRLDTKEDIPESSVRFLGSFNLPPHIKSRMRQLRWNMCLLHLTQFLGLVTQVNVDYMEQNPEFFNASKTNALVQVVRISDRGRMEELGLADVALARWADVAHGLQSIAVDYEPTGQVDSIDIFHAIPLKQAAASRQQWVSEHLSKWGDFSRTDPRIHAVGGAHYTMIGAEHVAGFAATLKAALVARGI